MKEKLKKLIILVFVLFLLALSYFIFKYLTVEKQIIDVKYTSTVYTDTKLEAIVNVLDKNENTKKSTVTFELEENKKGKKVKGIKEKYKLNEGDNAICSLYIPSDIESGKYNLKIKARSGLIVTKKVLSINVVNTNNSDIIISLDKGIYKPGDTIKYRALMLSKKDSTPSQVKKVNVEIFDGNGNKVYSNDVETTEFGIISGEFNLASEVNSGEYKITISDFSKEISKNFTVNPYVTPQFEIAITPDKEVYEVGETANIVFSAKYFFGEPVANATVQGKINENEINGLTDDEGKFIFKYEMTSKGENNILVSITDTSNYLIESSKVIYAQENPFEVETILENGKIYKNIDNNVYLFAKKIDGTPVKIKATINIGGIERQVITDENGVGSFIITSNDTNKFGNEEKYSISAIDYENNVYTNTEKIEVSSNSVVLTTDKVKYNQGDDINIKLSSIANSSKRNIYVCKNDEILKIISTDKDNEVINLEDISGLVDIFVEGKENYGKTYSYYDYEYASSNYIRKTIFIKPAKCLNIGISTDKEEYKPGENLTLSLDVKDENDKNVDANILISILDEAILSLANNDLSIDNIRLALKDIELSDDISTEDLYADILDNKSESKLMLALLKRDISNPVIAEDNGIKDYADQYIDYIIIVSIVLIILIFMYIGLSDSKKFKKFGIDCINVLVITILTYVLITNDAFYYYDIFDNSFIPSFISTAILVLIVYYLALYKIKDTIFNFIIELIFIPGIYLLFVYLIYILLDYNDNIPTISLFVVPVIMTILIVRARGKKLNKFWNTIKDFSIKMVKIEISYFLAVILTNMTFENSISFAVYSILLYIIINKIYTVKILKEKSKKINIKLNTSDLLVVGFFVFLLAIVIIELGNSNLMKFSSNVLEDDYGYTSAPNRSSYDYEWDIDTFNAKNDDTTGSNSGAGLNFIRPDSFIKAGISTSDASSKSNILDSFSDVFKSDALNTNKADSTFDITQDSKNVEESITEEKIEKVRNVFLESLAFIPDLVIKNGTGNTQIPLSDNITTWNIQVVGNTKNGNIGSTSKTFKVFKDFFVDFSLPTNSVVTDLTNIPVTIYNYKDTTLDIFINAVNNDWCLIGEYEKNITLEPKSTKLVYIPIKITKAGNNMLRVEANADGVSDIVERTSTITPNGYKKSNVISSGVIEKSFNTDYFSKEETIENTRNLKFKIYPTAISQAIEGMDSIFQMPTGCFEQTSSSLYPNILALKYLEDNNLDNEEIKKKAIDYISKGYQRILTFEVNGEKGGYSLYGDSPAEPVITAFGLMELSDAMEVYKIDDNVIKNMKDYLYNVQKINGSFNIGSTYIGHASSESDLAMNAYIIWALSEVDPEDDRINNSISYLESRINDVEDNYTLALMANAFTNVGSKKTNSVVAKLMEKVQETSENAYIESNIRDYYGSYGTNQAIQTTALTSIALSKNNLHATTNNSFIKYLISQKDSYGNWGTTQSTILALKAINMLSTKSKIAGQNISVSVNGETKDIKIGNNPLDIYEINFNNVNDEGKISIDMKKGTITYEVIEEYYVPYEKIKQENNNYSIEISEKINSNVNVNDNITQEILVKNNSDDYIANGLVEINIPQGCSVDQNFLEKAKILGIIEKYDYNYTKLNLYIRNLGKGESKTIEIQYRANYPEQIIGATIKAFDYYNPTTEGVKGPVEINIGM